MWKGIENTLKKDSRAEDGLRSDFLLGGLGVRKETLTALANANGNGEGGEGLINQCFV